MQGYGQKRLVLNVEGVITINDLGTSSWSWVRRWIHQPPRLEVWTLLCQLGSVNPDMNISESAVLESIWDQASPAGKSARCLNQYLACSQRP